MPRLPGRSAPSTQIPAPASISTPPSKKRNMGSSAKSPSSAPMANMMMSPGRDSSNMMNGMSMMMASIASPSGASSTSNSPMTYIPPLCDGACGTMPRAQQMQGMNMWSMMMMDMMETMRMMPAMCMAMCGMQRMRGANMSWADTRDMCLHMMLCCMEMAMMVMAVPMCMMMPGMMFCMWMGVCAMMVMAMCRMLNGREQMHTCNASTMGAGAADREGSWMIGQEMMMEDEKWMFMGGMGMSSRHIHTMTLPAMSRLFNRPMTCVCMPTYGLPFDMMMMAMQRCCGMMMPSQARRNMYNQMRCALLDDSMNRCVVLCQNQAAVLVSQCVSMLCADIPADKMRKLEVYTFGSAASEFVMPLGESNMMGMDCDSHTHDGMANGTNGTNGSHGMNGTNMMDRKGVHVEHFAMMNDPFAQMGVLRSVRKNMEGRYCGGVFVMNDMMMMPSGMMQMHMNNGMSMAMSGNKKTMAANMMNGTKPNMASSNGQMMKMMPTGNKNMDMMSMSMMGMMANMMGCGMMMEDYLAALFPTQLMGGSPPSTPATNGTNMPIMMRSILDSVMMIDRDCAEKREITAMSHYYRASHNTEESSSGSPTKTSKKRLSWTGLAAAAAASTGAPPGSPPRNGMSAGMAGLEMARKGCKNCDGHKGREVTWLVRYVNIGSQTPGAGAGMMMMDGAGGMGRA